MALGNKPTDKLSLIALKNKQMNELQSIEYFNEM